jgi:cell division transport system permease protein
MVTYVSEEDALSRAREELIEFQGIFSELDANPLPASLEIKLSQGYRNTQSVVAVADRLTGLSFADDIRYGHGWVAKLDRLRGIAAMVGLLIGGAFAVASIIIIGTTIRMSVLQRTREIRIMRLVGATDGFVRRPFLLEGCLKGALGGIAAVALNFAAYFTVDQLLWRAAFFNTPQALLIVGVGVALGFAASALSVGRHLGKVQ